MVLFLALPGVLLLMVMLLHRLERALLPPSRSRGFRRPEDRTIRAAGLHRGQYRAVRRSASGTVRGSGAQTTFRAVDGSPAAGDAAERGRRQTRA